MNKIFTFIIGLLVGAIITTCGFMVYIKTLNTTSNETTNNGMPQMSGNMEMQTPPDMNGNTMGEPPAKPDGETGNMEAPPEMQNNQNNQ